MVTVAVLNTDNMLVGYLKKENAEEKDIIVPDDCDLQTDGTYRWNGKAFQPLGFGHGKVQTKPPLPTDYVLYLVIQELVKEGYLKDSNPCIEWFDWYTQNMADRNKDIADRRRK